MNIDAILRNPHVWAAEEGDPPIAVSSRVRLARNLSAHAFPGWAGEEECVRIWKELEPILASLPTLAAPAMAPNHSLSDQDRQILVERHLVSREHALKGRGSGIVIREDEAVVLMVNEEDHLRMQALSPGLRLAEAWRRIDAVDSELEQQVLYAFSPRLGYLTACPTNVGTGMRASVMLHLPGLVLMEEMGPVINGIQKIGLAVRGLWGEGTDASGNMFQISNQMTLGDQEEHIVTQMEHVVREILDHEKNARLRLLDAREALLRDQVGRAGGILSSAHILTSNEALDLLSALRLGIDLGIVRDISRSTVDELLLLTQPAHIQGLEGRSLQPAERDEARARLVRTRLTEPPARGRRNRKKNE